MTRLKMLTAAAALAVVSVPAHAFMETLILGLTSVTNNLIDSSESVTNNAIDAGADSLKTVAGSTGLMADRIGVMADRIGFMADRIVTTEGLMAGLVHKIIDSNQAQAQVSTRVSAGLGFSGQPSLVEARAAGHAYSASSMIYGTHGATYTATTPAAQGYQAGQLSILGLPHKAGPVAVAESCKVAYGVPLKC